MREYEQLTLFPSFKDREGVGHVSNTYRMQTQETKVPVRNNNKIGEKSEMIIGGNAAIMHENNSNPSFNQLDFSRHLALS